MERKARSGPQAQRPRIRTATCSSSLSGAECAGVLAPAGGAQAGVRHRPDAELVHGRPQLPLLDVRRALHLVHGDGDPRRRVQPLDLGGGGAEKVSRLNFTKVWKLSQSFLKQVLRT